MDVELSRRAEACRFMAMHAAEPSWSRVLGRLSGALASVIFPSDCRICESLLTTASRLPICDDCLASFRRNPLESCDVCGVPWGVPGESDEEFRADEKRLWGELVVPVPLHTQRKKERGFNQVELFARPLAKRLGIPYRPVLLIRTRPRPEKHLLDYEERWESVRGAFALKEGGRVDNSRILLLDDVMTTGATLDACSRALADVGASSVIAVTAARAVRPANPAGR
jgi:predicted amidophosphoribosyltransferase